MATMFALCCNLASERAFTDTDELDDEDEDDCVSVVMTIFGFVALLDEGPPCMTVVSTRARFSGVSSRGASRTRPPWSILCS